MMRLYKVGWRGQPMTNSAGETRLKPDRTGKRNGRSPEWQRLFTLEDTIALLLDASQPLKIADQARIVIKNEAWNIANPVIYEASKEQKAALEKLEVALERLRAALSERWHYLMSDLDAQAEEKN